MSQTKEDMAQSASHSRNKIACRELPSVYGNFACWRFCIQSFHHLCSYGSWLHIPQHILQISEGELIVKSLYPISYLLRQLYSAQLRGYLYVHSTATMC